MAECNNIPSNFDSEECQDGSLNGGNKFTLREDPILMETTNEVVKFVPKRPYRVKLIDLADDAQAIWHVRDDKYLELKIFGFNSKDEPVQFVAPFTFESEEKRDETYNNTEKLTDFAKAVFVTQMANIDPELNTDNFKTK